MELLGRVCVGGARALPVELLRPGGQGRPPGDLALGRRDDPRAERLGQPPVRLGKHRRERPHQHLDRVEGSAADHPGMEVALSGSDADVEVADPAQRRAEARERLRCVAPVEDHRGVGRPGVGLGPVADRVAPDLLLRVDHEAHGDGELVRRGEELGRLQEHEEVRLVVGDAASDEEAVALGQRPRVRLPQIERIGRLHVEVRVRQHRGSVAPRGGDLAEDERPAGPLGDLDLPAGGADPRRDPVRRAREVRRVRRVGAHGRDRDQLAKLGDERIV